MSIPTPANDDALHSSAHPNLAKNQYLIFEIPLRGFRDAVRFFVSPELFLRINHLRDNLNALSFVERLLLLFGEHDIFQFTLDDLSCIDVN